MAAGRLLNKKVFCTEELWCCVNCKEQLRQLLRGDPREGELEEQGRGQLGAVLWGPRTLISEPEGLEEESVGAGGECGSGAVWQSLKIYQPLTSN